MDGLAERLARGDREAWAELYDACAGRVHHYLLVRLRSAQDADDVLQETFVRLARRRERLSDVANLVAYVFTVARNEAARWESRGRRRAEHRKELTAEALFQARRRGGTEDVDTADLIAAALGRLDDELREVVELRTYAGLTFREISEVTGLAQGTVATRYRTAIGRMRAWLARELS